MHKDCRPVQVETADAFDAELVVFASAGLKRFLTVILLSAAGTQKEADQKLVAARIWIGGAVYSAGQDVPFVFSEGRQMDALWKVTHEHFGTTNVKSLRIQTKLRGERTTQTRDLQVPAPGAAGLTKDVSKGFFRVSVWVNST
jgi:hypothetical protein